MGQNVLFYGSLYRLLVGSDPFFLEFVNGSAIGSIIKFMARKGFDGDFPDIQFPTLGIIIPQQPAPVAAGIVVEASAPSGDEAACIHLVIVLDLGGTAQVSGLLQPLFKGGMWMMAVQVIQVRQQVNQQVTISKDGILVLPLIGLIKCLFLDEEQVAEQLTSHPN